MIKIFFNLATAEEKTIAVVVFFVKGVRQMSAVNHTAMY